MYFKDYNTNISGNNVVFRGDVYIKGKNKSFGLYFGVILLDYEYFKVLKNEKIIDIITMNLY